MFGLDLLGDVGLTMVVSVGSLLAVWLPFQRGLTLCFRSVAATRRVPASQLRRADAETHGRRTESLALLMARVLRRALEEHRDQPREFLVDATRQYVVGEWETHYARLISMFANLLPPIGFIGTTGGMLILFLSMRMADASLELSALALALTSSIFALIGFSALEAFKIRLYARLLACLDDVVTLVRAPEPSATGAGLRAPAARAAG